MSDAYRREIEYVQRDISELVGLVRLGAPVDLTEGELLQAICLIQAMENALWRALAARGGEL